MDVPMPFDAAGWLVSPERAMMSLVQRAAYFDLLCHQWKDPTCSLPGDDETLAWLSGLGPDWFTGAGEVVRARFDPHPSLEGRIVDRYLLAQRSKRDAFLEKSRIAGLKSAKRRELQKSKVGSTNLQPTFNQPSTNVGKQKKTPTPKSNGKYCNAFEVWWQVYPRRAGKLLAYKAWIGAGTRIKGARSCTSTEAVDYLLERTHAFALTPKGQDPSFCPYPATWLNGDRWDDDPLVWQVVGDRSIVDQQTGPVESD